MTKEYTSRFPNSLVDSNRSLGNTLVALKEIDRARVAYTESAALAKTAAGSGNIPAEAMRTARAYRVLGDFEREQNAYPAAEAAYGEMLKACDQWSSEDPRPLTTEQIHEHEELTSSACERLGNIRIRLNKAKDARVPFERNLATRRKMAVVRENLDAQRELARAYRHLTGLESTLRDFPAAARYSEQEIGVLEPLVRKSAAPAIRQALAIAYLNKAWCALWNRRPEEAVAASRKGMQLDPDSAVLATNLAHAHLFAGRWEDAAAVYRKFRSAKIDDQRTFSDVVREDFQEFRKHGLTHPDMDKVEAILAKPPK